MLKMKKAIANTAGDPSKADVKREVVGVG